MRRKSEARRRQKDLVVSHFRHSTDYWNDIYFQTDFFASTIQMRKELALGFVDKIGVAKEVQVLDLGCGAGWTTIELLRRGFDVHALDAAGTMLTLARENCRKTGISQGVTFLEGDAENLPFTNNSFASPILSTNSRASSFRLWMVEAKKSVWK